MRVRVTAAVSVWATVLLMATGACGEDAVAPAPESECEAVAGDPVPARFDPFGLGDSVVVVELVEDSTSINARGLADAPLAQVYDDALRAARASGWQILNVELEVIDAEILLSSSSGDLLGLELSRGSCAQQTRVQLSYLAG
jgi:hypothetical protein